MKRNTVFKIGMLLNIVPFIFGIIFYEQLPDVMATHFGFNNMPNGFSSKSIALFGVPLFLIIVYVLAYFISDKDPKRNNQNEKLMGIILLFIPLINIVINMTAIYFNLGYKVDIEFIINTLLGILFVFVGNYLPKIKRNYTLGIKFPWTLDNDYVWDKTHRFAGGIWVVFGMLYLVSFLFVRDYLNIVFPVYISILIIVPSIYSYFVYKSLK